MCKNSNQIKGVYVRLTIDVSSIYRVYENIDSSSFEFNS